MLEELWVVVNSLLGNGSQDGLVTVRLFGFFGCLCYILSANINEFDIVVDDSRSRKARILALIAPAALLVLYALYAFSPMNVQTVAVNVTALISIAPALFAAYFSLKHLLLPEDDMGFLKGIRELDVFALVFYGVNYVYPLVSLHCPLLYMCLLDVVFALMLFILVMLCRKGAEEWKSRL